MKKTTTACVLYVLCCIIILSLSFQVSSCVKNEPEIKLSPDEIMKKITDEFPGYNYNEELYSDDKTKPVDLSKIEKYSVIQAKENTADEIGIFKLYDKTNTEYIKEIARTRILKLQTDSISGENTELTEIFNNAEVRSYGEYVYYVSHPKKDRIFEIIEDSLRGE